MREFIYNSDLFLPKPRAEVFEFFSNAQNLEILTPPWLKFEIQTPTPILMRPGALIDYKIHVHGFPVRWRTEILEWEPPSRFVDTQLKGPYTLWHHTHVFEERGGGTLCSDHVRYRPRGGWLVNFLFVERDIRTIFAFREKKLRERFGSAKTAA